MPKTFSTMLKDYNRKGRKHKRTGPAKRLVDRRQNRNIMKLWKAVKYGQERKYIDQTYTIQMGNSYANMLTRDLTYIPGGAGEAQRIGNKIKIHSHQFRVVATVGDSTNLYRFLVIRFSAVAAADVQIADALDSPSVATPFNLLSWYKRGTDSRYQILYDTGVQKLAGNEATTAPASASSQRVHQFKVTNPKGWFTAYSGSSASNCVQGYTYLIGCSDSGITPNVQFQTTSRTIFSG